MPHINQLSNRQLLSLRKEIVLNSLFLSDYDNSFGIDENEVYDFFDAYADYLCEIAYEEDGSDDGFLAHDSKQNLLAFRGLYA